jgi:hypothetical protein
MKAWAVHRPINALEIFFEELKRKEKMKLIIRLIEGRKEDWVGEMEILLRGPSHEAEARSFPSVIM